MLLAAAPILAQAQPVSVTSPAPVVSFDQWREAGGDEFGREFRVAFPSPLVSGFPENDNVNLRAFVPTDALGPVPIVILLHYWGATDTALEEAMARQLNLAGVAAVIIPLPYHLSRTPEGTYSGELAVQADTAKLVATMTQSVLDVRRTLDWVATRPEFDTTKIGLGGTSLGALVAALVFAVEPRITCGCFMLGGADLAHVLWNSSRVVGQRETLRQRGYTEDRLREELVTIEPLTYLNQAARRPAFVISARHDTVIPALSTARLVDSLGSPETLSLDTGHYGGALIQSKLVRAVVRFFTETLSGKTFRAPKSFYAPTVRLGLVLSSERGLQVGAGIDVWKSNARGDAFATAMVTPQGVQGFIGYRLGSAGLAVGATVFPKRTSLGVFWSTVF